MSRRFSFDNRVQPTTLFCKMCKYANKSKKEYQSHNTRDVRGKLCCPNIGNQNCFLELLDYSSDEEEKEKKEKKVLMNKDKIVTKKISWADLSDSDSDSDYEFIDTDSDDTDSKIHPNVTLRSHQLQWK